MLVVVDRKSKVVRVSGVTVTEASWLGYKFAQYNPDLMRGSPWCVVAFEAVPGEYSREETYNVKAAWDTAALRVAEIIKRLPSPVHACPNCKCKPECCT